MDVPHRGLPPRRRRPAVVLVIAAISALSAYAADAASPGRNGHIAVQLAAYDEDDGDLGALGAVTAAGRPARRLSARLTRLCHWCTSLEHSPSGRMLAAEELGGIVVFRADGSRKRRLTRKHYESLDSSPTWSPTGSTIAFSRPGQIRNDRVQNWIYTVPARGGRVRRLTSGFAPAWSSSNAIAFRRPDGIYVMRTNGSGIRRIADWRCNGAEGFDGAQPETATCVLDPSAYASGLIGDLDWSPDGRWLAACRFKASTGTVWVMTASGQNARRIPRSGGNSLDCEAAWSPDGARLAFMTYEGNSDGNRLVIARRDGRGPRRVLESRAFDFLYAGTGVSWSAEFRGLTWGRG